MSYYDDKNVYYNLKIDDDFSKLKYIDKDKIIYSDDDRGYVRYGNLNNGYSNINSAVVLNDLMLTISRDTGVSLLQLTTYCRNELAKGESTDSVIRVLERASNYLYRTSKSTSESAKVESQENKIDVTQRVKLERERLEWERLEKEKLERERLERERKERQEQYKERIIDSFMMDITSKRGNSSFRGWILPNGELVSQYDDKAAGGYGRQDHGSLFRTFMDGLKEYDIDSFNRMSAKYEEYQRVCGVNGDIGESFATEVLGWMQVNVSGQRVILYQGERWQDRLIRPFLMDYGFNYQICPNQDRYATSEFDNLCDHFGEILELGLKSKYNDSLEKLALAM